MISPELHTHLYDDAFGFRAGRPCPAFPQIISPTTIREAAGELSAAFRAIGKPLTRKQLIVLLAHTHAESGFGRASYARFPEAFQTPEWWEPERRRWEIPLSQELAPLQKVAINNWGAIHGSVGLLSFLGMDSSPQLGVYYSTPMRRYETREQGARDYAQLMTNQRYLGAWEAAKRGDARHYAKVLRAAGYYELNEHSYACALEARVKQIAAALGGGGAETSSSLGGALVLAGALGVGAILLSRKRMSS